MATRKPPRRSTPPAALSRSAVAVRAPTVLVRPPALVVTRTEREALAEDGTPLPRGPEWPEPLRRYLRGWLTHHGSTWERFAAPWAHAPASDEPYWLLLHAAARELAGTWRRESEAAAYARCLARALARSTPT